jgi:hypothetical protein
MHSRHPPLAGGSGFPKPVPQPRTLPCTRRPGRFIQGPEITLRPFLFMVLYNELSYSGNFAGSLPFSPAVQLGRKNSPVLKIMPD